MSEYKTKYQLYLVATNRFNELEERYEAARVLQKHSFKSWMMQDLIRMYPTHTPAEIAEHLGIPWQIVEGKAKTLGLKRSTEGKV